MNIHKEEIDSLNVAVSVEVSKDDYLSKVNDVLHDYRRKANVAGFRPGKVPEGLVRKMYGKPVLATEINKLVTDALLNYIKEQQWQLLGEAMPKQGTDDQEWEIGNDFTFDYEMGLAPVIDVQLSKEDRIIMYQIPVEQDMINRNIENYAARFGRFVDVETVVDFRERLTGNIVQLGEDGQPLPEGLVADETTLLLSIIKGEENRKLFENVKAGDKIVFNLAATFPNKWEILSILNMDGKEELDDISTSLFRFTVKAVQQYTKAEPNQELFDKICGEGVVKSLEEFENRIKEELSADFRETCMARFGTDVREYLLKKINPPLPEDFLCRWMRASFKEVDAEVLEKEIPQYLTNMKWDMIATEISKKNELQVSHQEIVDLAKTNTRQQFAMYGIMSVPDETVAGYALEGLKNEKNIRELSTQVLAKKIINTIYETVDLDIREISLDNFNMMLNASESNNVEAATKTEQTEI